MEKKNKRKDYINREDKQIYKLLIERPRIIQHALENYAQVVAYVDTAFATDNLAVSNARIAVFVALSSVHVARVAI